jgi:hypothetical protein
VLKGGLEFPAEAIVAIASHLLASLHDRLPVATSRAQAKADAMVNMTLSPREGRRKVNHRVIEPAPGNDTCCEMAAPRPAESC